MQIEKTVIKHFDFEPFLKYGSTSYIEKDVSIHEFLSRLH